MDQDDSRTIRILEYLPHERLVATSKGVIHPLRSTEVIPAVVIIDCELNLRSRDGNGEWLYSEPHKGGRWLGCPRVSDTKPLTRTISVFGWIKLPIHWELNDDVDAGIALSLRYIAGPSFPWSHRSITWSQQSAFFSTPWQADTLPPRLTRCRSLPSLAFCRACICTSLHNIRGTTSTANSHMTLNPRS